ncbi:MAG: ribosome silencing factor [Desulfobacterales bacterium]|jgi:ribosome-associated protein|nr:ribosome silencing factor [Desulfobacterales bacterium]
MTQSSGKAITDSLDVFAKAALGKKAFGLVMLDVHALSSVTDVFLICSGKSNRQVTAIAEHIQVELKKNKLRPLSVEGLKEGHWVVMDYGHVIIHVFYEPTRTFYDIEGLWADAKRINTPSMIKAIAETHPEMEPSDDDD